MCVASCHESLIASKKCFLRRNYIPYDMLRGDLLDGLANQLKFQRNEANQREDYANKVERVADNGKRKRQEELVPFPPFIPKQHRADPVLPGNYNTAVYCMEAGMYNYNTAAAAACNGFVGMHGAPVLAGGIPPTTQNGLAGQPPAPSSGPPNLPEGDLYGTPATTQAGNETSVPSSEDNNNSNTPAAPASNSMPPGMPNAMPAYTNPALFYGQQAYHMGQPHGVGGYGYGYGAAQFGVALQGGFGYQQGMMGQSSAYPYDDQQHQGNNAGYQRNNTGGYRGRGGGSQY